MRGVELDSVQDRIPHRGVVTASSWLSAGLMGSEETVSLKVSLHPQDGFSLPEAARNEPNVMAQSRNLLVASCSHLLELLQVDLDFRVSPW